MFEISDIPSDAACQKVNPKLFKYFQKELLRKTGNLATPNWSEAEVIQWLDLETKGKYLYDRQSMDQSNC